MLLLRRIATGVMIVIAAAVLLLSLFQLWNAGQWDDLPMETAAGAGFDARIQAFDQRLEIYRRRVNDMEVAIMILMGLSALYVIVFVLTADFNARSVARQADRVQLKMKEHLIALMTELRRLEDEVRKALQEQQQENVRGAPAHVERDLEVMRARIAELAEARVSQEQKQEILHYESALPALDLFQGHKFGSMLAQTYCVLGRFYRRRDYLRARFYLSRALILAPESFEVLNEMGTLAIEGQHPPDYLQARRHFEESLALEPEQQRARYGLALVAWRHRDVEKTFNLLAAAFKTGNWETAPDEAAAASAYYLFACALARRGQFQEAAGELKRAFEHRSRDLEDALTRDTEEGGDLYTLANTSPYDEVVNDLLLNVSVGNS